MQNLTIEDIKAMAEVDVRTVERASLTDIDDIEINVSKPVLQKLGQVASQSKNIYVTNIEDYVVKAVYQKTGPSIDDKMAEHLRRMVEIYF